MSLEQQSQVGTITSARTSIVVMPTVPALQTLSTTPSASLPPIPSLPSMPNYAAMFVPTSTASGVNIAFGVIGRAGFSFYFDAVSADQQKAKTVRTMQAYESSLAGRGWLIDTARDVLLRLPWPPHPPRAVPYPRTGCRGRACSAATLSARQPPVGAAP
ncbi:hypothetical protein AB0G02_27790 [Actinosynnema sp. NPDC023658]|uniref:hypothetical protein n=1 Tax=Actinosynnema sp. NPDC023658 TaxID=3155465 RepID=UPI0033C8A7B9